MQQESPIKSALAWHEAPPIDPFAVKALLGEVAGLHPVVAQILCQRGYTSLDAVRRFMTPDMATLAAASEMKGMQVAADRIIEALHSGEKILVYGDYDVDGSCATAMMYHFLLGLGAKTASYNPDRYAEGYGVSKAGVAYAATSGFGLVIALDCGIAAVERIAEAKALGIDFVVCDHHLPGAQLPDAVAILNPKQLDCGLQGEELCGCGVGFMLLRKISMQLELPDSSWQQYLPLVAVATCCDIVDLTGLNRILVKAGLEMLNTNTPPGIAAMLKTAAYTGHVNVADVVFKLGPRINAAGRLAHAREAVKLLVQPDIPSAMPYAEKLEQLNRERRLLDKHITAEAVEMMREADPELQRHTTVVKSADWHKGVIGIVASRLTEVCYRPTIVFTEVEGMLTGSARSVEGFNLYEAVSACAHLLENYGGHHSAAGMSLKVEHYEEFSACFENAVASRMEGQEFKPYMRVDVETNFNDWFDERFNTFFNQLNRLKPYGPKNLEPVFVTRNCFASQLRIVGTDHLKFKVYQDGEKPNHFDVIAFGFGHLYEALSGGAAFDLAYTLGSNHWNGVSSLQLEAKDLKLCQ